MNIQFDRHSRILQILGNLSSNWSQVPCEGLPMSGVLQPHITPVTPLEYRADRPV